LVRMLYRPHIRPVYLRSFHLASGGVTLVAMSRGRRSKSNRAIASESVRLYIAMQSAQTEAEYAELLARHDACTDAMGFARLRPRTLAEFREGKSVITPSRLPSESFHRTGPGGY
jgi:hypothetical protein